MYKVNHSSVPATLRSAVAGWARPTAFISLLLASVGYIAFGSALEALSANEPETSIVVATLEPARDGNTPRIQRTSGRLVDPADYFPAGYVNQGRDGVGDVKNYEHD